MADHSTEYLIVGAGLAGTSAAQGIRECDTERSIIVIGAEPQLPYDRPPLSKKLWFGKKEVKDIFLHDRAFQGGPFREQLGAVACFRASDPERTEHDPMKHAPRVLNSKPENRTSATNLDVVRMSA